MPWRPGAGEPAVAYRVLVSEFMLQQTRVETVLRYFEPFCTRFPTPAALAEADEQAVLAAWAGLGFYRRARNLHASAREIVDRFGGSVPGTVEELLTLPGVGRYTAGAVASIGFGVAAPILDGNVMRVLTRLLAIQEPVDQPATVRRLWAEADALLADAADRGRKAADSDAVRDFNQALMELGALVCTPTSPSCLACPLRERCRSAGTDAVHRLPVKTPKKAPLRVEHHVLAVERGGRWLFERRGPGGMWAGMWQMPTHEGGPADAAWLRARFGLVLGGAVEGLGSFEHVTTHRLVTFHLGRGVAVGGRLRPGTGVWRRLDARGDLPMARPVERVIERLGP